MTAEPCSEHAATLSFTEWKQAAVACLRERWPHTNPRQLESIAVELFADPYRGQLAPADAVDDWMQHMPA